MSREGRWHDGFVNQYFQIIEVAANGRFFSTWKRIEANNRDIKSGGTGEFGRHIELKLIQAEVPVNYLLNFSRDRMAESVNLGVIAARDWCRENGIELRSSRPMVSPTPPDECSGISFTEPDEGSCHSGHRRTGLGRNGPPPGGHKLRIDDSN